MLLMVERSMAGGICHAIHQYAKAVIEYMKSYDQNIKNSCILTIGM